LEGEQKRARETKREEGEQQGTDPKVEQSGDTQTNTATASSLAKEAGDTSTVDSHGTCSDGRCGENKCSYGKTSTTRGRV